MAGEASRISVFRSTTLVAATSWLLCLAIIYGGMLRLRPLPPPYGSQSNNYHRLIEISQQIRNIEKAGFPKTSEPQRQALIAETIPLLETGNFVPYDLTRDRGNFHGWNKAYIEPAQHVRSLARAIDAQAAAALAQGEKDRACDLTLANVRLGLMLERGSTVVEYLIGVAVQSVANHRLIPIRGDFSPEQARRVIAAWDGALEEAESVDSIINRDAAMAERAYGWAARLANLVDWAGLPETYFAIDEAGLRLRTTARLLQADLALRLYQRDNSRLPANLEDLIPDYLTTLPIDPYSNKPLIYRTDGGDFALYSVGRDRTDNGGNFTNIRNYYSRAAFHNFVSDYDFDVDTVTRP